MPAALRLMAPRCVARKRFFAPECRLFESQRARTSRVYKGARVASSARQGSMVNTARCGLGAVNCRCRREEPARGLQQQCVQQG